MVIATLSSGSHRAERIDLALQRLRTVATEELLLVLRGHHGSGSSGLAVHHASDGVLWCREASQEGDQAKDAGASAEHVESPAKGCYLEAQNGLREHVRVLGENDGTRSS